MLCKGAKMNTQKNPKAIYRVTLANGDTQDHTYAMPSKFDESAKAWIVHMINMIQSAMTHKKGFYYVFNNPLIYYNPDYVVSIKLTYVDCEECEELIAKITKDVFKPPIGHTR